MSSVNNEVLYQCCFLKARQNKYVYCIICLCTYVHIITCRCNVIVNHDGKPTTVLPTEVKQLFKTGVGKLSSKEYSRSSKRCDYSVLFLQDNQYYCGFIEKFLVASGKVKM